MSLRMPTPAVSVVLLALLLAGCGSDPASQSTATKAMVSINDAAAAPDATATSAKETAPDPMPRKIIYTATLEMNTIHFQESVAQLTRSVKAHNGYIAETSITGTEDEPKQGVWKVRIPVDRYDAFIDAVGGMGEVTNSSSTAQDVSEEFYDIQARLKNKRIEEARLLHHLQASTGKLAEILTVEKEISRVREEIERMEGRMRFLAHQTDFTTVTINLHELPSLQLHENSPSFGTQIRRAFTGSATGLGAFTKSLVLILAYLLPWLAIAAGIGVPIGIVVRKRRGGGKVRTDSSHPSAQ